jgi:hypothetical protein
MLKAILKRFNILFLTLPIILLALELGIRIAVPQPVEDLAYEDVYTERYSPSLNAKVMSLVPRITRTKNNAEVHINNDGNRDYEYLYEKKDGVTRIAIVGSSVAFGFNLELEDTFGKQLETKLNRNVSNTEYEVLLFGRPGFKTKAAYAEIKDRVFNYDPDLIIYSFVQNSYEDQSAEDFFFSQKNNVSIGQNNGLENPASSLQILRRYWGKIRNHNTVRIIRTNLHLYLFSTNSIVRIMREISPLEKEKAQTLAPLYPDTQKFKQKIANTESWISMMNQECMEKNIKFAILMHPYEMQLTQDGAEEWITAGIAVPDDVLALKTHLIMEAFSLENNINYINIIPALRTYAGNNNLFIEGDYGHYNKTGHKIIADFLSDVFYIVE